MSTTLNPRDIKPLISGEVADPFTLLGAHPVVLDTGPALAVRAFLPGRPERGCPGSGPWKRNPGTAGG